MAFLYMHLSETLFKDNEDQRQKYLKNALRILEHDQHGLRGRRMTFVCGDPGDYMFYCVSLDSTICLAEVYFIHGF